jgi:hypothetical protein
MSALEKLKVSLRWPKEKGNHPQGDPSRSFSVSVSIGINLFPEHSNDPETLRPGRAPPCTMRKIAAATGCVPIPLTCNGAPRTRATTGERILTVVFSGDQSPPKSTSSAGHPNSSPTRHRLLSMRTCAARYYVGLIPPYILTLSICYVGPTPSSGLGVFLSGTSAAV